MAENHTMNSDKHFIFLATFEGNVVKIKHCRDDNAYLTSLSNMNRTIQIMLSLNHQIHAAMQTSERGNNYVLWRNNGWS